MKKIFNWTLENKNLIPLSILSYITMVTVLRSFEILPIYIDGEYFYGFTLRTTHGIAISLLSLTIVFYFINRCLFTFLNISLLVTGILNLAEFTTFHYDTFLKINSINLYYQPLSSLFLIIFLILNFNLIRSGFSKSLAMFKSNEPQITPEEKTLRYKIKFEKKSNYELEQIVNHPNTLSEAKKAANILLAERESIE